MSAIIKEAAAGGHAMYMILKDIIKNGCATDDLLGVACYFCCGREINGEFDHSENCEFERAEEITKRIEECAGVK
jgi:hypothetical protein